MNNNNVLKLYKVTYAILQNDKEYAGFNEILDIKCVHYLAYSPEEAKEKCILQFDKEVGENKNLKSCIIVIDDNEDIEEITIGESKSIM